MTARNSPRFRFGFRDDLYDLWRILGTYRGQLDLSGFPEFLRRKCSLRRVDFAGPESFFQDSLLSLVEKGWSRGLGSLVPGLPAFETVMGELRPQITLLFSR